MGAKRKASTVLAALLVLTAISVSVGFYVTVARFSRAPLNSFQEKIKEGIVMKWERYIRSQPEDRWALTSYQDLLSTLNFTERIFVKSLFDVDPKDFGFNGPYYGNGSTPELIKIEGQKYVIALTAIEISPQYVPKKMFEDLQAMLAHMERDLGRSVLVLSGWRSRGYQAHLFLSAMKRYGNSIAETLKVVSFPGYSEHASHGRPAVDFLTEKGVAGSGRAKDALTQTSEYYWLLQWAPRYNFHLSYPKDDRHQFEPGHWHWRAPKNAP